MIEKLELIARKPNLYTTQVNPPDGERYYLLEDLMHQETTKLLSVTVALNDFNEFAYQKYLEKMGLDALGELEAESNCEFWTRYTKLQGNFLDRSIERWLKSDQEKDHIMKLLFTELGIFQATTQVSLFSLLGFAGTADIVAKNTEGYILIDVKSYTNANWIDIEENPKPYLEKGWLGMDGHIQSYKKSKYRHQLAAYWYGLEQTYQIKISKAYIFGFNGFHFHCENLLEMNSVDKDKCFGSFLKKVQEHQKK